MPRALRNCSTLCQPCQLPKRKCSRPFSSPSPLARFPCATFFWPFFDPFFGKVRWTNFCATLSARKPLYCNVLMPISKRNCWHHRLLCSTSCAGFIGILRNSPPEFRFGDFSCATHPCSNRPPVVRSSAEACANSLKKSPLAQLPPCRERGELCLPMLFPMICSNFRGSLRNYPLAAKGG